jgi:hypothetical protein
MKPQKLTAADVRELARKALGYNCLLAHDLLESWLRSPDSTQESASSWLRHVPENATTGRRRKRASVREREGVGL